MHNIFFITLINIGDAVLKSPVLERLHQRYPHIVGDTVTELRSSFLFEHCPYHALLENLP